MEDNSRPNQCERVINYLNKHGSITQDIAEKEFGCKRLPSRIFELTDMGYKFNTIKEAGKNRYGEPCYWTRYFVPKKEVIGYARINNWGQSYSTYDNWVEKNAPEYLSQYKNSRIKANWESYEYFNGRAGEILCQAPHGRETITLYLIRIDEFVYLINKKGLGKIIIL